VLLMERTTTQQVQRSLDGHPLYRSLKKLGRRCDYFSEARRIAAGAVAEVMFRNLLSGGINFPVFLHRGVV
jgi:hypothetical protein